MKSKGRQLVQISVPPDVRKRMRAYSKTHRVNWSAVAVRAFRDALRKLDQIRADAAPAGEHLSLEERVAALEQALSSKVPTETNGTE